MGAVTKPIFADALSLRSSFRDSDVSGHLFRGLPDTKTIEKVYFDRLSVGGRDASHLPLDLLRRSWAGGPSASCQRAKGSRWCLSMILRLLRCILLHQFRMNLQDIGDRNVNHAVNPEWFEKRAAWIQNRALASDAFCSLQSAWRLRAPRCYHFVHVCVLAIFSEMFFCLWRPYRFCHSSRPLFFCDPLRHVARYWKTRDGGRKRL